MPKLIKEGPGASHLKLLRWAPHTLKHLQAHILWIQRSATAYLKVHLIVCLVHSPRDLECLEERLTVIECDYRSHGEISVSTLYGEGGGGIVKELGLTSLHLIKHWFNMATPCTQGDRVCTNGGSTFTMPSKALPVCIAVFIIPQSPSCRSKDSEDYDMPSLVPGFPF